MSTEIEEKDLDFIKSALNAHWYDAYHNLERKDLGDIERENYQYQLENAKRILTTLESIKSMPPAPVADAGQLFDEKSIALTDSYGEEIHVMYKEKFIELWNQRTTDIKFGVKEAFLGDWQATFTIGVQTFSLEPNGDKNHALWYVEMLKKAFNNLTDNPAIIIPEAGELERVMSNLWDAARRFGNKDGADFNYPDKDQYIQQAINQLKK